MIRVGYALIFVAIAWAIALGFLSGVTHERERWAVALGACDLPTGKTEALVIYRDQNGQTLCYKTGNPWTHF
jgi:hypothetical protein